VRCGELAGCLAVGLEFGNRIGGGSERSRYVARGKAGCAHPGQGGYPVRCSDLAEDGGTRRIESRCCLWLTCGQRQVSAHAQQARGQTRLLERVKGSRSLFHDRASRFEIPECQQARSQIDKAVGLSRDGPHLATQGQRLLRIFCGAPV